MPRRIVILGAGAGGLCTAMRLVQAGIRDFTILEKSDGVGGTWRDNTYPGACCDVKSHLYSFSFEPNPDWSHRYSEQPEILAYFERCAERYDLAPHLRTGVEIASAVWEEESARWVLTSTTGERFEAEVVVSGLGQLNRPYVPDLPGLDSFAGPAFHSARWDHDVDLTGRRVAVVGSAASAVQFVPRVASVAAHIDVYQRSANWVGPKPNPAYSPLARRAFRAVPALQRAHRAAIYWAHEARWSWFRNPSRSGRLVEGLLARYLESQVADADLRAALTPTDPIGCKRILAASDWYPTLTRDDVDLCTTPIERVTPSGIVTTDGVEHPADVLVFATGFDTTHFLAPVDVVGRGGVHLHDRWRDGAAAYLGLAVPGFPNLFLLYGPNTNLGHNSILFMLERQVDYLVQCLDHLDATGAATIEVTPEAFAAHDAAVQERLGRTVWVAGCRSWYKNEAGRVTNNWCGSTMRYWLDTRRPRWTAFRLGWPAEEAEATAAQAAREEMAR